MLPETEESVTGSRVELRVERTASNVIEAAAAGTSDGVKLWLNVIAMLIAFMGLVALCNWPLEALGAALELEGGLSIQRVFGWVFAPVAWFMGVDGMAYIGALSYSERDPELDLKLVEVTRLQMAADLERLPADAWLRSAIHSETGLVTVRALVLHAIRHVERHVDAIRLKREALGLSR